ncbi:Putative fructose-bisphosphate aldolase [Vanrija pseudolonga]|uniref:Fructose-bisphosphate aldolase n=1 Tax=Vanrija pseudolonga TaxID=143232 RepID=A0AAF1BLC5_9TREE|nr:Putative fructose-bisphosphate aldolase [Vanrija pseudolonga]
MSGLKNNRTLEILRKAEEGRYGILAQCVYDANQALAFVRACEAKRSPGILQLFPITVKLGGGPFLRYCIDICHAASVPISVHMDHATDAEALEQAIGLAEQGIAFDSIMVDASHAETDEENIAIAVPYIQRCNALGIATEVELGRLEGGEAGLRVIDGGMLTDPSKAEAFMAATGADILAPSIGNLHGSYKFVEGGPNFRQEILKDLQKKDKVPYLCLHGTDEISDDLFRECIANGVSKVNVNSWLRDPYCVALAEGLTTKSMPEAIDDAIEALEQSAYRFFDLLGSAGKA